jgi:hypothetical protein
MDPWQQTVETRLGELRADVGELKIDVAVIKERIGNLPTKGYIVKTVMAGLALIAALLTTQTLIQNFVLKPAPAATAPKAP